MFLMIGLRFKHVTGITYKKLECSTSFRKAPAGHFVIKNQEFQSGTGNTQLFDTTPFPQKPNMCKPEVSILTSKMSCGDTKGPQIEKSGAWFLPLGGWSKLCNMSEPALQLPDPSKTFDGCSRCDRGTKGHSMGWKVHANEKFQGLEVPQKSPQILPGVMLRFHVPVLEGRRGVIFDVICDTFVTASLII